MTQMRLEDVSAALEVSQRPSRHDALPQLVAAPQAIRNSQD